MKTDKPERLSKFYSALMKEYTGEDRESKFLFDAGFVYGLAEKVYIGACDGAMTRSYYEDRYHEDEKEMFNNIAYSFDLYTVCITRSEFVELWMLRWLDDANLLLKESNNNIIRGQLCGYKTAYIDPNFELEK